MKLHPDTIAGLKLNAFYLAGIFFAVYVGTETENALAGLGVFILVLLAAPYLFRRLK